jgi:nicotinate-nucleotide pyrophosphorylase (carboxylating)
VTATGPRIGVDDGWAPVLDPPHAAVVDAVSRAIAEDVLPLGDLTAGLVPSTRRATVDVVSRADGVVAGRACAVEAFAQIDGELEVTWLLPDGSTVAPGDTVATVAGPLRSILTAERTALNFLGHLSGVATLTRAYVDVVHSANPSTRVLDTRKTTPGLRALEKAAVRAGGGFNHRGSLSDAVLVKDNHLGGATITEAVGRAKRQWPGRMVEVECDRLEQVTEAVAAGATVIMLDNMGPDRVAEAVALVRKAGSDALIEVSGGVTLESAPALAAAGADLLSAGALTHSAPVLDIGMDFRG